MRWIDFDQKKPTDTFPGWTAWTPTQWERWLEKSEDLLCSMRQLYEEACLLTSQGDAKRAAEKIAERNAIIDGNGKHWGKLKDWLLALSHGKCWFSESRDVFSHYDVEHFRPKKEAKDDENRDANDKATVRDGYWWLAFDYTNFRICGNVGNSKKGGWFPLQAGSPCSTFDNPCEETEVRYLLDPTDPTDVDLIAFDEEGKAIAAPDCSDWEKMRVEVSVKRLKLDEHEPLRDARKAVWQAVTREIDGYLTAKQRAALGGNLVAKEKLKGHLRKIREMQRPEEPLSSVVRWCITFRNDPRLLRLIA